MTDPVMVLATRRRGLLAEMQPLIDIGGVMLPGDPHEADNIAAQNVFWDQISVIEEAMMRTVPTSAAGVAEQLEILRDFLSVPDYERLIDIAQAGLRTL